jgi:hypothetical protein
MTFQTFCLPAELWPAVNAIACTADGTNTHVVISLRAQTAGLAFIYKV